MIQEDKKLLLKDISARLLYGVVIEGLKGPVKLSDYYSGIDITKARLYKPYLRPMSSMTEDEQRMLDSMCNGVEMVSRLSGLKMFDKAFDWLNSHHFDYHGLIEKGLALEALEDMYKTE